MKPSIFVVEDDPDISRLVRHHLEADGFAPSFDFGAQVRPTSKLTFGASYRPRTSIDATGEASGNASAQLQALGGGFAQAAPGFHYEAQVRTVLPQMVSTGAVRSYVTRAWLNCGGSRGILGNHIATGLFSLLCPASTANTIVTELMMRINVIKPT